MRPIRLRQNGGGQGMSTRSKTPPQVGGIGD